MKRWERTFRMAFILGAALIIGGCASYYQVHDPVTNRTYYTEKLDRVRGGGVQLIDAETGAVVTLQNTEVKEISKDEFNVKRYGAPKQDEGAK